MLVLSRRIGQTIVIGADIIVTVLGMCDGRVRIGIQAPRTVSIAREEVAHRNGDQDGPDPTT